MISKKIRIHRKDSAFVYAILESLEGMTTYSTLPNPKEMPDFRDLQLWISTDFESEINQIIEGFRKKFDVTEI